MLVPIKTKTAETENQALAEGELTESFFVKFPGGNVQIIRTTDDAFWVHVQVNRSPLEGEEAGRIKSARLDCVNKPVEQMDVGDFNNPGLYHIGILIERADEFIK